MIEQWGGKRRRVGRGYREALDSPRGAVGMPAGEDRLRRQRPVVRSEGGMGGDQAWQREEASVTAEPGSLF